jgi:TRAP-type C4-dicarboxylate transport system permease small subunit
MTHAARLGNAEQLATTARRLGEGIVRVYRIGMNLLSILTSIGLASIIVVVLCSVAVRYFGVFQGSLDWATEYSRFGIVWVVMLGSAVAFDRGAHVGIDFTIRMPPALGRIVRSAGALLGLVFVTVLAWQGFVLSFETMRQISPALGLPMGYAYLAIPTGASIMALQSVLFAAMPALMVRWAPSAEAEEA